MIYFDNAATTRTKPDCVLEAFLYYVKDIGASPGRGSYKLGIDASRMLYQSRKTVAHFFGIANPSDVVFTKNSTEAINLFLRGYLRMGDHVLISPFEHNAVLRPLHMLKEKGIIDYTVLPEAVFYEKIAQIDKFIRPNTRLGVFTLASNLTGQLVFSREIAQQLKNRGVEVFVDASQGGGKIALSMEADGIDYLAFTSHKDLLGLPGAGGLCSAHGLKIEPLIQGGTGIRGDSYINPDIYPEAYESGTLNMPAIWALKVAMDYVSENREMIAKTEKELTEYLIGLLSRFPQITIYRLERERVSTLCFNVEGVKSNEIVEQLSHADICVRGGIHCAILAHETIGTEKTGAVRLSLNASNTREEIDFFIEVMEGILANVSHIL